MIVDVRTIVVLMAAHLLICGALFRVVRHRLNANPALDDWGNGSMLFGLGYLVRLAVGLEQVGPISVAVGCAQLLAAMLLLRGFINCGESEPDGRRQRAARALMPAWMVIATIYVIASALQIQRHFVVLHLLLSMMYLATGFTVLAQSRRAAMLQLAPMPMKASGALLVGLGVMTSVRTFDVLEHPAAIYRTAFAGAYFVASSATVIILTFLMLWIMFARLSHRLTRMASRDALTGVLNRHGLQEAVARHFRQRRPAPIAILQADIDHFKQINDRHGHDAGDRLLQAVGDAFRKNCRAGDIVARIGGEEFLVACVGVAPAQAFELADSLRERIGELRVATSEGDTLHCTVSIGVSSPVADGTRWEEAYRQADAALYRAKSLGRNMSVAHFANPATQAAA